MLRRKYRKIHNLYSSNKKEVRRIAKNGEEITKNISFILQFIDSRRLIASSLTNLVNNIFEWIHRIKYICKKIMKENVRIVGLNTSIAKVFQWKVKKTIF